MPGLGPGCPISVAAIEEPPLTLVILKGDISHKEFWRVDLTTGRERQLITLSRGFAVADFDISPDGREIIFDRTREESDIVQFDVPDR